MEAEFRVLGLTLERRGVITDQTLALIDRCFRSYEVEVNGQRFLFLPRPPRPRILVGGWSRAALRRAIQYGDGWMPTGGDAEKLRATIKHLREAAGQAGKPAPQVVLITSLPLSDPAQALERLSAYADAGVTGVVHGWRYGDAGEFGRAAEALVNLAARLRVA